MDKLIIKVHTPGGVGEATLTRADILNNKWIDAETKQNLLDKFTPYEDKIWYNGDKYFKVAEGKKVKISETDVYYNPRRDKYLAIEKDRNYGYFDTYTDSTTVVKENVTLKYW